VVEQRLSCRTKWHSCFAQ